MWGSWQWHAENSATLLVLGVQRLHRFIDQWGKGHLWGNKWGFERLLQWIKINQNGWSIRNEFLLLQNLNLGKTCIFCVNKCNSDCFNHFFVPHLPGMGGVKASVENAWNSKSNMFGPEYIWVRLSIFFAEATRSCLPGVLLPQSVAQQEDRQNNVYSYSSRSIDFAGSQNLNHKKNKSNSSLWKVNWDLLQGLNMCTCLRYLAAVDVTFKTRNSGNI